VIVKSQAVNVVLVTPLDVVKIRLQAQQKPFHAGSYFVYNNGLMDCLCVCSQCSENGNGNGSLQRSRSVPRYRPWYTRPGHFNGTLVGCSHYEIYSC